MAMNFGDQGKLFTICTCVYLHDIHINTGRKESTNVQEVMYV